MCAGINKLQTRQTKQASLTSFVENTNKRHADDTQSTSNQPSPFTNSQTTNMAATSPVTPVLEAATTPNNTTDTSNAEVTNNDIKLLLLQLERRLSQGMSDMNSQLSDKIDDVKSGDIPFFRQPVIPTAHYSDGPLFRQPIIPTNYYPIKYITYLHQFIKLH